MASLDLPISIFPYSLPVTMSFSRVGEDVLPRISCGLGGVWGMGMGYGVWEWEGLLYYDSF